MCWMNLNEFSIEIFLFDVDTGIEELTIPDYSSHGSNRRQKCNCNLETISVLLQVPKDRTPEMKWDQTNTSISSFSCSITAISLAPISIELYFLRNKWHSFGVGSKFKLMKERREAVLTRRQIANTAQIKRRGVECGAVAGRICIVRAWSQESRARKWYLAPRIFIQF